MNNVEFENEWIEVKKDRVWRKTVSDATSVLVMYKPQFRRCFIGLVTDKAFGRNEIQVKKFIPKIFDNPDDAKLSADSWIIGLSDSLNWIKVVDHGRESRFDVLEKTIKEAQAELELLLAESWSSLSKDVCDFLENRDDIDGKDI